MIRVEKPILEEVVATDMPNRPVAVLGFKLVRSSPNGTFTNNDGEHEVDKERFEKLKDTQVERVRDEEKAIEVTASEVKEMRRREGQPKEQDKWTR